MMPSSRVLVGTVLLALGVATPAAGGWESIAPPRLAPSAEGVQLELIDAIANDDRDAFESAIDFGADPSSVAATNDDRWALCEATGLGGDSFDAYYLDRLLAEGADPNAYAPLYSVYEDTALACALTAGNMEAVQILTNAGADDSTMLCPQCNNPDTPFTRALGKRSTMPFALEIIDRRRLTEFELETMRSWLSLAYLDGQTYRGDSLRAYLEDQLVENGLEPLEPKHE